jgi:LPXTG-motif cell wall-anchored protein
MIPVVAARPTVIFTPAPPARPAVAALGAAEESTIARAAEPQPPAVSEAPQPQVLPHTASNLPALLALGLTLLAAALVVRAFRLRARE